jgi:hypothetical protein
MIKNWTDFSKSINEEAKEITYTRTGDPFVYKVSQDNHWMAQRTGHPTWWEITGKHFKPKFQVSIDILDKENPNARQKNAPKRNSSSEQTTGSSGSSAESTPIFNSLLKANNIDYRGLRQDRGKIDISNLSKEDREKLVNEIDVMGYKLDGDISPNDILRFRRSKIKDSKQETVPSQELPPGYKPDLKRGNELFNNFINDRSIKMIWGTRNNKLRYKGKELTEEQKADLIFFIDQKLGFELLNKSGSRKLFFKRKKGAEKTNIEEKIPQETEEESVQNQKN